MVSTARLTCCLTVLVCVAAAAHARFHFESFQLPRQPPRPRPRPQPAGFDLGSSCLMPEGRRGRCGSIQDCASLTKHLRRKNVGYLKQLVCGKMASQTLLCCPDGITPPPTTPPRTPPPSPDACGITKLFEPVRVVGGQPVKAVGTFPWMVALRYSAGMEYQCGAAVIGRRWLLTAAHCVNTAEGPVEARVGDVDLATTTDDSFPHPPQDVVIERMVRHPQYSRNFRGLLNDVALIKLKSDIKFSDVVKPICLPTKKSTVPLKGGTIIAGWGLTMFNNIEGSHIMQYAELNITDIDQCQKNYYDIRRYLVDTDQHVCASGNITSRGITIPGCLPGDTSLDCQGGVDTCRGDSGGPMMAYEKLDGAVRFRAVGIVSFALGCGSAQFPGIYTRVDTYLDWIEETIAANGGR